MQPARPLINVTAKVQFALSPSWCGNHVLYYIQGGSLGGPFTVMRWDRASGKSTVYSLTSGLNVPELHFPSAIPDDGKSMCPF